MIVPAFFHQKQATSAMLQHANGVFRWFRVCRSFSNPPSLRMAMTRIMNGEKSNFQISAISMNPSCIYIPITRACGFHGQTQQGSKVHIKNG